MGVVRNLEGAYCLEQVLASFERFLLFHYGIRPRVQDPQCEMITCSNLKCSVFYRQFGLLKLVLYF
jgi:hypothetical protein